MSPPDGRSSRWSQHRQDRRAALLKTARRAVHRLGPGASMEDIATAAETSKSVFYRYFGDKAGLQQAMGEEVVARMQEQLLAAARQARSPRDGLRAMVAAYLHMAASSPNVYMFVTQAAADTGTPALDTSGTLSSFFDAISAMLASPMKAFLAEDSGAGMPPSLALWPRSAIGMVRAAGEQWLALPEGPQRPTEEDLAEAITGWLFDGIALSVPQHLGTRDASPTRPPKDES
ncbi:TetR family transcriptional regulator [Arthrobacter sp. JZ12]|uniref:TetR/AcrR family transcriptional regulator n=1 Tax=Arthrobacter sp. JZ12 TaxID=2654190 RepID=UPI002B45B093|nr:TetR/AcrR family transcriptional regulator [Arthrobacter sp. JZ12]WRH24938.1 TetR family transcriptional regulator [Arthrobacter sp. JZ12]